jgi:hypothetical protein
MDTTLGKRLRPDNVKFFLDDEIDCVVGICDMGDGNVADLKMFDVRHLR